MAHSQVGYVDDITISKDLYIENFQEIIKKVNKKYSHFENKSINKDSLGNLYLKKAKTSNNNQEYIDVLIQYFAALENGHSKLQVWEHVIDAWPIVVENRVFIELVNDSTLINNGVKPKDEILNINNLPAIKWMEKESIRTYASTNEARLNWTSWRIFSDYFKGERSFKIKTSDGIKNIKLEFSKIDFTVFDWEEKATSKVINDSIGYINIPSMTGGVVEQFEKEYKKVQNLPNLIIDLRKNTGGSSGKSELILRSLINEPLMACVSRAKIAPNENSYNGKLFVLIGINTFSSAESFVIDLHESNRAILIGSSTAGDTGNRPKSFTTKHGFKYRIPQIKSPQISFGGFPMEGTGIKPHFEVYQTVKDYLKNEDSVLEYTIEKINTIQ